MNMDIIMDYADSNYSLMPTYEWIDIEDSGNPLNDVNDDDGDNQDEVQTISLPFNFNFYGITYDEISVSSNGWISFEKLILNHSEMIIYLDLQDHLQCLQYF